MSSEQREQSKLAIATFIVATGIVAVQSDDTLDSMTPGSTLSVLYATVGLAISISVMLALLYILGKASELRDKPPQLYVQKIMVRHREKFYSLSVTIYLPFIGALGGFVLLMELASFINRHHIPLWVPLLMFAVPTALITWFRTTNKTTKS